MRVDRDVATDLLSCLERHAAQRPDAVALTHVTVRGAWRTVTWAELRKRTRYFGAHFKGHNFRAGLVPMIAPKSPDLVAAMLGAVGAGSAFACLNPKLQLPQLLGALRATSPRLAVVGGASLGLLLAGKDHPIVRRTRWLAIDTRDDDESCDQIDALRAVGVLIDEADLPGETANVLVPLEPSESHRRLGCCLFTSGSTGNPKGVAVSVGDLVDRARTEAAWFSLSTHDVLLSILPFSFDVGLSQLLGALWTGCELVIPRGIVPPIEILESIRERGVTGICGVPTIWQDVIRVWRGRRSDGELARLRFLTISGGSLELHGLRQLAETVPNTEIFKTYGQTETFRSTSLRPDELWTMADSVGRAYPGVQLRVVRPDNSACDPGEVGEVVHIGMGTMLGYLRDEGDEWGVRILEIDQTKGVMTGDHGYLDSHRYLFLVGRRDSMAKIAGNRVYPAEAAQRARELPGVQEAEVVVVKETGQEPVLVCWIVPEHGVRVDAVELRKALRSLLPSFMIPKHFLSVQTIPRLSNGKPDLLCLQSDAATQMASWASADVD